MRKRYTDQAELKQLLDKTTRFTLLAEEAERRGFGKHENVAQTVSQNAVQQLMRKDFDDDLPKGAVTDEEVAAYYQEHLSEYQRPATRRASHILVGTLDEAKAILAKVKAADMREFRTLAREHSIDEANKLRGGDLQYFDAQGHAQPSGEIVVPAPIAKAVMALKEVGDTVSVPVKIDGGYSILRLTGERAAIARKQAEVADSIRTRLWRARRQDAIDAFVKKLSEQYKPELNVELIELVKVETGRGKAHGMPEGFPEHRPGDSPSTAEE
jgi:parvulin-like peptidyl-prolyl isomerase